MFAGKIARRIAYNGTETEETIRERERERQLAIYSNKTIAVDERLNTVVAQTGRDAIAAAEGTRKRKRETM